MRTGMVSQNKMNADGGQRLREAVLSINNGKEDHEGIEYGGQCQRETKLYKENDGQSGTYSCHQLMKALPRTG